VAECLYSALNVELYKKDNLLNKYNDKIDKERRIYISLELNWHRQRDDKIAKLLAKTLELAMPSFGRIKVSNKDQKLNVESKVCMLFFRIRKLFTLKFKSGNIGILFLFLSVFCTYN
jgi:hypothetical protein